MIILLILIPIIGSLMILPLQEDFKNNKNKIKTIALTTSIINFIVSIFLWLEFDSNTNQYQFVTEFDYLPIGHLIFGVDGISLYFVLLTTFITPIAILSNYNNIYSNVKYFLISLLILESLQLALFLILDLLLFYVFFESVLPLFFIKILVYGSGESRDRSANLLFLYTLFGSLFMALAIVQLYSYTYTTDFQLLSLCDISLEGQILLWLAFF